MVLRFLVPAVDLGSILSSLKTELDERIALVAVQLGGELLLVFVRVRKVWHLEVVLVIGAVDLAVAVDELPRIPVKIVTALLLLRRNQDFNLIELQPRLVR